MRVNSKVFSIYLNEIIFPSSVCFSIHPFHHRDSFQCFDSSIASSLIEKKPRVCENSYGKTEFSEQDHILESGMPIEWVSFSGLMIIIFVMEEITIFLTQNIPTKSSMTINGTFIREKKPTKCRCSSYISLYPVDNSNDTRPIY